MKRKYITKPITAIELENGEKVTFDNPVIFRQSDIDDYYLCNCASTTLFDKNNIPIFSNSTLTRKESL